MQPQCITRVNKLLQLLYRIFYCARNEGVCIWCNWYECMLQICKRMNVGSVLWMKGCLYAKEMQKRNEWQKTMQFNNCFWMYTEKLHEKTNYTKKGAFIHRETERFVQTLHREIISLCKKAQPQIRYSTKVFHKKQREKYSTVLN